MTDEWERIRKYAVDIEKEVLSRHLLKVLRFISSSSPSHVTDVTAARSSCSVQYQAFPFCFEHTGSSHVTFDVQWTFFLYMCQSFRNSSISKVHTWRFQLILFFWILSFKLEMSRQFLILVFKVYAFDAYRITFLENFTFAVSVFCFWFSDGIQLSGDPG
jgi:hypothetical protein